MFTAVLDAIEIVGKTISADALLTQRKRFCRINLQKWKYGTCQSAVANVRRIYLANA